MRQAFLNKFPCLYPTININLDNILSRQILTKALEKRLDPFDLAIYLLLKRRATKM